MITSRFFFAHILTDRSSDKSGLALLPDRFLQCLAFSPGNFFADQLDRTVIY